MTSMVRAGPRTAPLWMREGAVYRREGSGLEAESIPLTVPEGHASESWGVSTRDGPGSGTIAARRNGSPMTSTARYARLDARVGLGLSTASARSVPTDHWAGLRNLSDVCLSDDPVYGTDPTAQQCLRRRSSCTGFPRLSRWAPPAAKEGPLRQSGSGLHPIWDLRHGARRL
jgi:hypothetical protein